MTNAMLTYATAQMANDPRTPIGISREGTFASRVAADTDSNPVYAKKTTAAAVMTPVHPNRPHVPVFCGTKGCQLSGLIKGMLATMISAMTASSKATTADK